MMENIHPDEVCKIFILSRHCRSSAVKALHKHHKGAGLIPVRGPIVDDEFFSTLPSLNFDSAVLQATYTSKIRGSIPHFRFPLRIIFRR